MKTRPDLGPVLWIVTGASGFLGNTLVRQLLERGQNVRAVDLAEGSAALKGLDCEFVAADVTGSAQVEHALSVPEGTRSIVLHCAGIVSIAGKVSEAVRAVNVGGTKNVIDACRRTGVDRLVYVSSVHAIPEPDPPATITEKDDPQAFRVDRVVGEYAQTKAEATALVLEATDLDRVVVHPSGLIGPGDYSDGHMTGLVRDAASGEALLGCAGRL